VKLLVVILNYRVSDLPIDCLRSLAGRIGRRAGGVRRRLRERMRLGPLSRLRAAVTPFGTPDLGAMCSGPVPRTRDGGAVSLGLSA